MILPRIDMSEDERLAKETLLRSQALGKARQLRGQKHNRSRAAEIATRSVMLLIGHVLALALTTPTPLLRAPLRHHHHRSAVVVAKIKPLEQFDDLIASRTVRVANHAAALTSLAYFGLVSSTMQARARASVDNHAHTNTSRVSLATSPMCRSCQRWLAPCP